MCGGSEEGPASLGCRHHPGHCPHVPVSAALASAEVFSATGQAAGPGTHTAHVREASVEQLVEE